LIKHMFDTEIVTGIRETYGYYGIVAKLFTYPPCFYKASQMPILRLFWTQ
jgi:hypothetical protein